MNPARRFKSGFSLVEVTLALGVTAFSLVAIFGLIPIGMNYQKNAVEQTAAIGILSAVSADLRATASGTSQAPSPQSAQFGVTIPAPPITTAPAPAKLFFDENGASVATAAAARYRMTIYFVKPQPDPGPKGATRANLVVTWPAPVDPAAGFPAGSVSTFVALDRN